MRLRLTLLALAVGLAMLPRSAAATPEVRAFVEGIGTAAVRLLRDGIADDQERRAAVGRLLAEGFDTPGLARLSLGRFWRAATDAQRREFQGLFEAFLVNLYSNSLERPPDAPPPVTGFGIDKVRAEPERGYAVLSHFERPAGPPFRVEWQVEDAGPGLRIIDVAVEGISMVVLFRQMLAGAVHEAGGSVDGLLARLRDMVGAPAAAVPAAQTTQRDGE